MVSQLVRKLAFGTILVSAFATPTLSAQDETKAGPYDFVPGERILYSEDFQPAPTGSSAVRRLSQATPRMSVDPREGRPFLHTRPPASFIAELKEVLPDRFTIDFDMYIPGMQVLRLSAVGSDPRQAVIDLGPHSVAAGNSNENGASAEIDRLIPDFDDTETMHYSLEVDGPAIRVYVGKFRVLDAPRAGFGRSKGVKFEFVGGDDPDLIDRNVPIWITDIRIAAGGNPISYDELISKGKLVTHGILFDTGSERIRPESGPTLQLIGDMLSSHADLKLTIEGHTDNVGAPATNRTLSQRRADAVKQYIVSNFRVNGARLVSKGFGDTKPVGSNTTAEGRRQNRRVELVKQ